MYYVSTFYHQLQHFHEFFEHFSSCMYQKFQITARKFRQSVLLKKKFFCFDKKTPVFVKRGTGFSDMDAGHLTLF
jgi:hypothetical protein